jgi:hypothetical protein
VIVVIGRGGDLVAGVMRGAVVDAGAVGIIEAVLALAEVTAALRGTSLADLPVGDGPAGALVVSGIDSEDSDSLLRAWRVAHGLLPVTGRWPVLMTTDGVEDLEDQTPLDAEAAMELRSLDRAARIVDPWPTFQRWDDGPPDVELSFYTQGFYGVDVTAEVLPRVVPDVGRQLLLRAAYDRVLSDADLTAQVLERTRGVLSTDCWYVPDNVSLLLLPTALPWLAPDWINFYGALGHREAFAAALWQWHERWDARLVACWGTMLQFDVHRPPQLGDDAWTAARQLLALAPNFDIHQWELAVAISIGDAWFVHNRP